MYVKYAVTVHSMYRVINNVYIWLCEFNVASLIVGLNQVSNCPTVPLSYCSTLLQLHLYDGKCEPDNNRNKRREACIAGSGRATEGYRP